MLRHNILTQNVFFSDCGTACYQENNCWSFLFFRSKTPPTCTLLNGPIDRRHMDQNTTVDYYEVWVREIVLTRKNRIRLDKQLFAIHNGFLKAYLATNKLHILSSP